MHCSVLHALCAPSTRKRFVFCNFMQTKDEQPDCVEAGVMPALHVARCIHKIQYHDSTYYIRRCVVSFRRRICFIYKQMVRRFSFSKLSGIAPVEPPPPLPNTDGAVFRPNSYSRWAQFHTYTPVTPGPKASATSQSIAVHDRIMRIMVFAAPFSRLNTRKRNFILTQI